MIVSKSKLVEKIDAENEKRAALLDRQISAKLGVEYHPHSGEAVRFEIKGAMGPNDGGWFAALLHRIRTAGWSVDTKTLRGGGIVLLIS